MIKQSAEHARVRIAALRALRSNMLGSLTERSLARFAETDANTAGAVLRVLAHERLLKRGGDDKRPIYTLAQGAEKGAAV